MHIELNIVKNLEPDADSNSKKIAQQFICIFCNKFVVPDFKIGKEGIEKDSIKLP